MLTLLLLARAAAAVEVFADEELRGRGVLTQLVLRGPEANATRSKWRKLQDALKHSEEVYVTRLFCDPGDGEARCAELLQGRLLPAFPAVVYGDAHAGVSRP